MSKWLTMVVFVIIAIPFFMIYKDETRPLEVKQAEERERKDAIVGHLEERCVKGVMYYFTDGAHYVRFAPVVDAETLTFKRCQ